MDRDEFESSLAHLSLSEPSTAYTDVALQVIAAWKRRGSPSAVHLAGATVGIWLVALAGQVVMDRSLDAIAPAPSLHLTASNSPSAAFDGSQWTFLDQRRLLETGSPPAGWPDVNAEEAVDGTGDTPGPPSRSSAG
jgi:hypothetical protein